jgi:hypothetical protein
MRLFYSLATAQDSVPWIVPESGSLSDEEQRAVSQKSIGYFIILSTVLKYKGTSVVKAQISEHVIHSKASMQESRRR